MARFNPISLLICCLVLCGGFSGASMAAVELETGIGEIAPSGALVVIEDERANWTREEAIERLSSEGQAWDTRGFPTLGYSDSAFWASIDVENRFLSDQIWLVKMKFPQVILFRSKIVTSSTIT